MSGKVKIWMDAVLSRCTSIISGDSLLAHGIDRQLGIIFYVFLLLSATIAWDLVVERDLAQVEKNRDIIEELRINWQQRSLDMVGMDNRDEVERLLRQNNSTLHAPAEPPQRILMEGGR